MFLDQLRSLERRHHAGEYLSDAEFARLLQLLTWTFEERALLRAGIASPAWPTSVGGSLLTDTPEEQDTKKARELARQPVVCLDTQRRLRRGD